MACETICTFFYVFLRFFQNPKKHDFLRFFELLHTFSRTMVTSSCSVCTSCMGDTTHSWVTWCHCQSVTVTLTISLCVSLSVCVWSCFVSFSFLSANNYWLVIHEHFTADVCLEFWKITIQMWGISIARRHAECSIVIASPSVCLRPSACLSECTSRRSVWQSGMNIILVLNSIAITTFQVDPAITVAQSVWLVSFNVR